MYSIRVYEDGTVIYCGQKYVLARGYRTARISPASVDRIRAAFRSIDFLQFTYECEDRVLDVDEARLFYREGGKARLIYDGNCWPDTHGLTPVEDSIDALVDSKRWIGESDRTCCAEDFREEADSPTAQCESLTFPGVPEEDGHHVETGMDLLNP